jgi:CcmD family protein
MKKLPFILLLCLFAVVSHAQTGVDMADSMRAEGKIYVVVGVLAIIFAIIVLYLVLLDRRLAKLEKKDKP